ncbi:hypothetical protein JCM3765_005229 [Sporobolomyces pararoseus]
MSLNNLPVEVFHLSSKRLATQDHLNLLLVSKKIRSYAQSTIQLHYELVITWSSHVGSEIDKESAFPDEQRRNKFFRTVQTFPHLLSYLTSLSLLIDPSTCGENTRVSEATIELLRGAVRLSTLHLTRPHLTGCESLSFAILDAIPPSVTRLELEGAPISQKGLEHLLSSHSSIGTLDLIRVGILGVGREKEEEDLRFPTTLKILRLSEYDRAWHPSLESILAAATSLVVYSGCFFSARYLISLDLSHLTSLSLTSPAGIGHWRPYFYDYGSQPASMAQVTSALVNLLVKTSELLKLEVHLDRYCRIFDRAVPSDTILAHLPNKLQSLSLEGSSFFTNHDLLRYLASRTRSSRLSTLNLPLAKGEEKDENVLDICQDRGIRVTFERLRF